MRNLDKTSKLLDTLVINHQIHPDSLVLSLVREEIAEAIKLLNDKNVARIEGSVCLDLRECVVRNNKAYFHRWSDKSRILPPSLVTGGHNGGVIRYTVGIIEYVDDGTVHECYPNEIRFISNDNQEG